MKYRTDKEKNLVYQYEMLSAKPLALCGSYLFYLNSNGLSSINIKDPNKLFRLDLTVFEPYEEVIYLPSINRLLFVHFTEKRMYLNIIRIEGPDNLFSEDILEIYSNNKINTLYVDQEQLFTYFLANSKKIMPNCKE